MNKKIRIVIILMSLALTGIVSFQVYWIYQNFQVQMQRMEKDVQHAMRNTTEKVLGESIITIIRGKEDEKMDLIVRPHLMFSHDDNVIISTDSNASTNSSVFISDSEGEVDYHYKKKVKANGKVKVVEVSSSVTT